MNLLSWLGDVFSSDGSNASGSRGGSGKGVYIPDPLGRLGQGNWRSLDTLPDPFGRLPTPGGSSSKSPGLGDWQDGGITLLGSISASGDNRPGDVMKVENMLGKTGHLDLGATAGPTGYFGARTEQAVKGFQKDSGLKVDGLLKPGGETIRALAAKTGSGEASPGMRLTGHRSDPIGYPQTEGRAPVRPDAGTGTRQPRPGEKQVALGPAAAAIPAGYEALLAMGLLGGLASKELMDKAGKIKLPGSAGPRTGQNYGLTASPDPFGDFTPPSLDGRALPGTKPRGGSGAANQNFDVVDRPLPSRTETPAATVKLPDRMETPADPSRLPDRLENPIPNSETSNAETYPDQSGEFDGFNIVEAKELTSPNNLNAGELPKDTTREETARLPSGLRELVKEHFLSDGIETHADKTGSIIKSNDPAAKGEQTFERMVKALGGDPIQIKAKPMTDVDGTVRTFKNTEEGYTINWRTKSSRRSGGKPTLEIQWRPPGQGEKTYYRYKKRYNP